MLFPPKPSPTPPPLLSLLEAHLSTLSTWHVVCGRSLTPLFPSLTTLTPLSKPVTLSFVILPKSVPFFLLQQLGCSCRLSSYPTTNWPP
ncbi:hypothetical protein XENTR_v10002282 [Xenopus tropicalis]|nr:hypothetical protein XENTR_v10002282 [Xenopus tropicalis]